MFFLFFFPHCVWPSDQALWNACNAMKDFSSPIPRSPLSWKTSGKVRAQAKRHLMGSIHQNGDRLREPKVGDTRRPAAGPGSRRWVDRLCRQHERQSSSCRRSSFSVQVCAMANDPSVWTPNVLWLEKQAETTKAFFRAWHVAIDHRSSISIVGPGIVRVHALWTPRTFFLLLCQPFYIFTSFPFSFLFSFSGIVALHKHWRMLDHLTVISACFGDAPWRQDFGRGGHAPVDFERFSERSCGFSCCCFSFIFFFFIHFLSNFLFLSFSLWWLRTFFFFLSRNSLGVHLDWDVICSTVDIVVAFKASGLCAMGKRAGVSVPTVFKPEAIEDGVDRAKACLVPLKKKTWAWGMSPNLKFHTPANPRTCSCTEQTHKSNWMFLDEPWRLGHCFQRSCLLPLSFVIHRKVFLWLAVDWFRWHLSIPQRRSLKCIQSVSPSRRHWLTLPVSQGTGGSLFPSVRATRSDTVSVRPGNVKLGLDSKKKEAYQLPLKSEQRKNFRSKERTTFISLHALCTQCFARFSVSPTFLRANFWWIAPIA